MPAALRPGAVIRYPFLWKSQHARGESAGRKERPCAVALRITGVSGDMLVLFPITTRQPEAGRMAVEVPSAEVARAGLDRSRRSWIIFDEVNTDRADNSYNIAPRAELGTLSAAFFGPIVLRFIAERRRVLSIPRG
jgi:hypothetical protein